MESEKRPKRPRIGSMPLSGNMGEQGNDSHYERVNYTYRQNTQGYQNPQNDANQQSYPEQQSNPAYQKPADADTTTDAAPIGEPYQPRQGVYQPRQMYSNNQDQQGYRPRQGYQNNRNYQNQGQGYQQRPGYQNNRNYQGGQGYQRNQGYQNYQNQGGQGYQRSQGGQGYQNNRNYQGGQGYQRNQGYQNGPGYQNYQGQGYQRNQGGQGYQRNQGFQRNQGYQRNQGGHNMKFTPRPKQIDYIIDDINPDEEIRLNKYMANAGICSRREADEYITNGLVKVNGEVVTELGTKIKQDDVVEYDDKVVVPERKCYVLLNKPKDCVTTSDDPNGRITVLDIVKNACKERIYPVGRLDRNTTGVLLLTNDGDLASKLTHPKFVKKKIYHVWTDKDISEEDMQRIADGIELPDGEIHADAISYVSETDRNQAGIEIHSGRNRIVRRIFEHLGYRVTKLDRVYFAGLTKKNLPRGRWRYLTQEEVTALRTGRFE